MVIVLSVGDLVLIARHYLRGVPFEVAPGSHLDAPYTDESWSISSENATCSVLKKIRAALDAFEDSPGTEKERVDGKASK